MTSRYFIGVKEGCSCEFIVRSVEEHGKYRAGKVGLAPANARVEDYVFLIDGIEKAPW